MSYRINIQSVNNATSAVREVEVTTEELRMLNGALNLTASFWRKFAEHPENADRKQVALDEAAKCDDLSARIARIP